MLLRGINVGGQNKLPMKTLTALLEGCGTRDVTTVIQSGNVILNSDLAGSQLAVQTQDAIANSLGFSPTIMILPAAEFAALIDRNPFASAETDAKTLHAFFAEQAIQLDTQCLAEYKSDSEACSVDDQVFWLHAPDGIGRSKLVRNIAKITQCDTTARNWNTLSKLRELVSE